MNSSNSQLERQIMHSTKPLQKFMTMNGVTDIMVNPDGRIWIDHIDDGMYDTGETIEASHAEDIGRLCASSVGDELTPKKPSFGGLLPTFQTRIQIKIPPIVSAPTITIRIPDKRVFTLDNYLELEILSNKQMMVLKQAVKEEKNILVVGGTGSGKTFLTKAILVEIAKYKRRLYIVEDTPELDYPHPNCHMVLAKRNAKEGEYGFLDALADALRDRPDSIIFGEVRDGAALDLMKAWNTGHNGGVCTIHSNTASSGVIRLMSLIEERVVNAPVNEILEAIDFVVCIKRDKRHISNRVVTEIVEIQGYDRAKDKWSLKTIG